MNTVTLTELLERLACSGKTQPSIPELARTSSVRDAAHQYAESGLYILPIVAGAKNPGSILGQGWPDKSSRDPAVLDTWFSAGNRGIALHTGRSGLVVFDVDKPHFLPRDLRAELQRSDAPFQASDDTPGKGHHIFTAPPGRSFGTSTGRFNDDWGDVRGGNSVIVLSPSLHARASEGAAYRWVKTGTIPVLPRVLAAGLPDRTASAAASSDSEHERFLQAHASNDYPELLPSNIRRFRAKVARGSRHTACMKCLVVMFKDAAAGLYPARDAQFEIERAFRWAKPEEEWSSRSEFMSMAVHASGFVRSMPEDEIRAYRDVMLLTRDYSRFRNWDGGAR